MERSVQRVFVIFSLSRCPCKSRIARVNESARRCVLILGFWFAALPSFARSWPSSFAKSAARLEGLSCYSMCKHRISHVGMRCLPSRAPCSLGSKREIPSLTEVKTCGFCRDYPWHLGGSNLRRCSSIWQSEAGCPRRPHVGWGCRFHRAVVVVVVLLSWVKESSAEYPCGFDTHTWWC